MSFLVGWGLAALVGGAAAVGGVGLRAAHRVLRPPRIRGREKFDPRFPPMPFQVRVDPGTCLHGLRLRPARSRGLVVMCHNLGSSKARLLPLAAELCAEGFEAAVYDLRGHGESGDYRGLRTSFQSHARDLERVIDGLTADGAAVHTPVGLVGFSLGTVPVILAAARHGRVRGVVVDSGPAFSVSAVFRRRFDAVFRLPRFPFARLVPSLIGWSVSERAMGRALEEALDRFGGRSLLVIHGDREEMIPREDAHRVFERAATDDKELWTVPHARHLTAFALERAAYRSKVAALFHRSMEGAGGGG